MTVGQPGPQRLSTDPAAGAVGDCGVRNRTAARRVVCGSSSKCPAGIVDQRHHPRSRGPKPRALPRSRPGRPCLINGPFGLFVGGGHGQEPGSAGHAGRCGLQYIRRVGRPRGEGAGAPGEPRFRRSGGVGIHHRHRNALPPWRSARSATRPAPPPQPSVWNGPVTCQSGSSGSSGTYLVAVTAQRCELPNCLVLSHFPERRDKPAWRRRWKSSTSKG